MVKSKKTFYTDIPYMELAGYKKKSFSLPFGGGEIFCEHLDGIYQYEEAVLEKMERDSVVFLSPSSSSRIIINFDETEITDKIIERIVYLLSSEKDKFKKVAFVGIGKKQTFLFRDLISDTNHSYIFKFFYDYEKAKEWVIG